ncbi:MAG TPA: hypothetical protein VL728_03905 [Cyclobacteriaceae bacterium]|nr:hypothetical protein [Cyclobacteriaceae bacterium]
MPMLIEEKPLAHWLQHFYGYGSWHARTWFISHEDGGGDLPEEVAEKLNYFHKNQSHRTQPTVCDIRECYRHFSMYGQRPKSNGFSSLYEYRFGEQAQLSGVWKNLISFEHGLRGRELPDLLDYQRKSFAEPSAQREALIKLFPLPSPHNHAWYYSWLDLPQFPFLKSRAQYQEHMYADRVSSILQNIAAYKPEVVLMYGMENINGLKKSVQAFFRETKFKIVKAEKMVTPQYHRADINGTVLLITTQLPSLRHGRVETGFDWQEFGKQVRATQRDG